MTKMIRKTLSAVLLSALCLALTGCAGKTAADPAPAEDEVAFSAGVLDTDSRHVEMVISAGETALLDELENLESIDLSGSENVEEIAAWAAAHPDIEVTYTVALPNGTVVDNHTKSLDLSADSGAELEAAAPRLALLPKLERIKLGAERANVSWDQLEALHRAVPDALLEYSFDLYGTECDLSNTTIDLYHVPVEDNAVLVERVMPLMVRLVSVDMDSSGVPNQRMEELRQANPDVKVVWRVWFGDTYSVRTDVEKILASRPSVGGMLTPENSEGLYHSHDVKYLDVGHNELLTDIGFVAEMPKLEVAVLAMAYWTDATPLASCPELEYLEMFSTECNDLSPLSGLTKLRHLNVANIGCDYMSDPPAFLRDITPLYSLTGLERLWLGSYNYVPQEQIDEMQRCAPNCEINASTDDPTGGRWRIIGYDYENYMSYFPKDYHPRYVELLAQFAGEGAASITDAAYSYCWNDPLYY